MPQDKQKIALASDHAGFSLKAKVSAHLVAQGYAVADLGPDAPDRMDYPDTAHQVAKMVADGGAPFGILVCGSGVGMAMAANRHARVRAANCTFESQATLTRNHNDANVLCLGERVVGHQLALSIVDAFLTADFDGGRHQTRIEKIDA